MQYRLPRHPARSSRNLVVVGEEDDQAIYGWRGTRGTQVWLLVNVAADRSEARV